MKTLTKEQKRAITKALTAAGADRACPRCGNQQWIVLDGYFVQPIQPRQGGLVLGGRAVPSAVVACTKCGFLSQHSLGLLGLMEVDEPNAEGGAE